MISWTTPLNSTIKEESIKKGCVWKQKPIKQKNTNKKIYKKDLKNQKDKNLYLLTLDFKKVECQNKVRD